MQTKTMYDFQVFQKRVGGRGQQGLFATLSKNGMISFTDALFKDMKEPKKVLLLWDKVNHAIGIRVTSNDDDNGVNVNPTTRSLSAQAFCKYYRIPIETTRRYTAHRVDPSTIVFIPESSTFLSAPAARTPRA